jgi:hypothetical protein
MATVKAEDFIAIEQALYRYCHGVDRGRAEIAKSCFWPEATDHHGDFDGPVFELIDRVVERSAAYPYMMQHHLTNIMISIEDDRANVESYFLAQNPVRGQDDSFILMFMGGRYLDRFERRNGEWKSAKREVVIDWAKHLDGAPWPRQAVFASPGRGDADATHTFFSQAES